MTKNKYWNFVLENGIFLLDHDTLVKLKKEMISNRKPIYDKEKEKKIFKLIKTKKRVNK